MNKNKALNCYYRLLRANGWESEELKDKMSRKVKKHGFGTRRMKRRYELEIMRTREHCKHEQWDTSYSYIPGEFIQEPDHDFCINCGMTEMELAAQHGNEYWQREYPLKPPKQRTRAIKRLEDEHWRAKERRWANESAS